MMSLGATISPTATARFRSGYIIALGAAQTFISEQWTGKIQNEPLLGAEVSSEYEDRLAFAAQR